ncbi:MAG TPA: hypothetical protein VGN69_10040 [Solirubrobacteraceae bacterium]|jgi:hypothetical protein|nr:hypothetical protein [Solirubrobacteraceae bacterium]
MAPGRAQRVSLGFSGGQVLSLRLPDKQLTELRGRLEQGGWLELDTEEGVVALALGQIVYVRVDSDELRVGFGA